MGKKEVLSLSAAIGFILIWIIDLNTPLPKEIEADFWGNIFAHYPFLMFGVGCLFYYQFAKNERIKKEKDKNGNH
jgi:hypothetical protein